MVFQSGNEFEGGHEIFLCAHYTHAPLNIQVGLNKKVDTLAERIKSARAERKLTQVQLAESAGMKQSDISKLERRDSLTSVALPALARALQCDVDWLDTGDGVPDYGRVLRGWPFPRISRARFAALKGEHEHIEGRLLQIIEDLEAKKLPPAALTKTLRQVADKESTTKVFRRRKEA
jgi:transcriptional regulator with XRE-family HTH domain